MAIQKTQAIVLKKFDFRDTSLIVTLFTRDFGKLKTVVKGVRKEASSDLVHFETLNHLDIVFYEKSQADLHLLSDSFLMDPMLSIRNSFKTYAFGCFLAELVDSLFDVHAAFPAIFDKLLETLAQITPENVSFYSLVFELDVLNAAGLTPGMKACVRCAKANSEKWVWSPRQGGLLCTTCSIREAKTMEVSPSAFLSMQNLDPALQDHPVYADIEKLVREFIRARVEYPIRSAEFLLRTDTFRRDVSAAHQISR